MNADSPFYAVTLGIGQHLARRREGVGMSMCEAAEVAGLAVSTLSRIERGKQKTVTIDTLLRLSLVYGAEPKDFLPTLGILSLTVSRRT